MRTLADFPARQNSLNFLRLVLAVLVIISHAWPIGGFGPDPQVGEFSLGSLAVAGFFGISGWLITRSRMSSELPSFLWRRFCRIYPGYFVVLLAVAFAFAPLGAAASSGTYAISDGFRYFVNNLGLYERAGTVGDSLPSTAYHAWNGSLWTLIHEVACYFVIGFIVTIFGRRWTTAWVAVTFVATSITSELVRVTGLQLPVILVIFTNLAPFFFAGALLYLLRRHTSFNVGCAVLGLAWTAGVAGTGSNPVWAALPVAYLCLWIGATLPRLFQQVGQRNDISYGTYIYAFPVQQLIALLGGARFGIVWYTLTCVALTLPLAALSWIAVERPAQNYRQVFDRFPLVRSGFGIAHRPADPDLAAVGSPAVPADTS